jgi:membrane fusion protein (multidrug efflux system)
MSETTIDSANPPATATAAAAPKKRSAGSVMLVVVLAAGAAGGAYYWSHRFLEGTDDAQLEGELVAVPARVGGVVNEVDVVDNQPVKQGQLLFVLDPEPAKARLAQAEAELAAAQAALAQMEADAKIVAVSAESGKNVAVAGLAGASAGLSVTADEIQTAKAAVDAASANAAQTKTDLDRLEKLVAAGAATQAQLDNAKSARDTADANLAAAKARLASAQAGTASAAARVAEAKGRVDQASAIDAQVASAAARVAAAKARVGTATAARDLAALDLRYTRIVAPCDGIASKKAVAVGQAVGAGQTVVTVVPTSGLWVTANFKETQIGRMRPGQPVHVAVDAFGGRTIEGTVESFSGATGARFALLPPDNATGNYTKVVQRVPVRVKLAAAPADLALRPGMSVEVEVDTR